MIVESLEKLRNSLLYEYDCDDDSFLPADMEDYVDEIEEEIKYKFLERPLFEDGKPVQFGDYFVSEEDDGKSLVKPSVQDITFRDRGVTTIWGNGVKTTLKPYERAKRYEKDSQDLIDDEVIMPADDYCRKYNLDCDKSNEVMKMFHLLKRQRMLDGDSK